MTATTNLAVLRRATEDALTAFAANPTLSKFAVYRATAAAYDVARSCTTSTTTTEEK
jgi:hypothetical protein